jgi:serine/threonine protein kinase
MSSLYERIKNFFKSSKQTAGNEELRIQNDASLFIQLLLKNEPMTVKLDREAVEATALKVNELLQQLLGKEVLIQSVSADIVELRQKAYREELYETAHAICDGNIEIFRKIADLRAAYKDSPLEKLMVNAFKTFLAADGVGSITQFKKELKFIDNLIAFKEPLEKVPLEFSQNFLCLLETISWQARHFIPSIPGFDDSEALWLEDDVWNHINSFVDFLFVFTKSQYKDQMQYHVKLFEWMKKNLDSSKHVYFGRLLCLLRDGKCKDLQEILEVADLDLPANYIPIQKLGEGAVSKVYLAKNTSYNSEVALKILKPEVPLEKAVPLALSEIAKIRKLQNKNIVLYYDPFEYNGKLIIPMEPYEKTLKEELKDGPLPLVETLHYCQQISSALEACHEEGIMHHDFGPGNIGIDATGQIKLADFNLSLYPDNRLKHFPLDYVSPGQLENPAKTIQIEDNVWSLAVIFYEMLTGKRIFSPTDNQMTREQKHNYIAQRQMELMNDYSLLESELNKIVVTEEDAKLFWKLGGHKVTSFPEIMVEALQLKQQGHEIISQTEMPDEIKARLIKKELVNTIKELFAYYTDPIAKYEAQKKANL